VNWGWFLLRIVIAATILTTIFLSQRFWYRAIWQVSARWSAVWVRVAVRLFYVLGILLVFAAVVDGFRVGHRGHLIPRDAVLPISSGLWLSSALFAFLAVKIVHAVDRLWRWGRALLRASTAADSTSKAHPPPAPVPTPAAVETVADPSRRYLFRTAKGDAAKIALAGEILKFAEDQFVIWDHPPDLKTRNEKLKPENWFTPCSVEQYAMFEPISGSSAFMIVAYVRGYEATGKKVYLDKADALANALTRAQAHHHGRYPTRMIKEDLSYWINSTINTARAMQMLADAEREAAKRPATTSSLPSVRGPGKH